MCDQHSNCILTIVNGQINPTKKDNNINSMNNKLDHIHNLLSESAVKLLNNKAKYSKCPKHNVLLMGDSHMRAHLITTERFHIHAEFTSNNHLNDNQTIFSNPIFDTLLNTHRPWNPPLPTPESRIVPQHSPTHYLHTRNKQSRPTIAVKTHTHARPNKKWNLHFITIYTRVFAHTLELCISNETCQVKICDYTKPEINSITRTEFFYTHYSNTPTSYSTLRHFTSECVSANTQVLAQQPQPRRQYQPAERKKKKS